jgi:hypothetical protein
MIQLYSGPEQHDDRARSCKTASRPDAAVGSRHVAWRSRSRHRKRMS